MNGKRSASAMERVPSSQRKPGAVGVDLDNTLICYDDLFHSLATERGLIPASVRRSKRAVRDALWARGLDDEWTALQGIAYGSRLLEAPAFPGAVDSLRALAREGISLYIVSHKTRFAARGPKFDLRDAALKWLTYNNLLGDEPGRVPRDHVFFEDSPSQKCARIRKLGCRQFVDDLRELLLHLDFPSSTRRILFDPNGAMAPHPMLRAMSHWNQLRECILPERHKEVSNAHAYRSL